MTGMTNNTRAFDSEVFYPGDLGLLKRVFERLRGTFPQEEDDLAVRLLAIFRTGVVTEDELAEAAAAWPVSHESPMRAPQPAERDVSATASHT